MDEQQVIDIVQRFFDTMMSKKSATDLPTITTVEGFNAIGVDATKRSVQVPMELLKGEAGDPLTVRKTYQTESEALADKNPIDTTTSLPLTVGLFVSIVNDGDKNGIYRISSIGVDGTMSLELQGKLGDLSDYANHGYESNPKTLKEVDDEKANHGYDSAPKTLKEVEDSTNVKIENLVENGDFSNGETGWVRLGSPNTVSITDKMIFNGAAANPAGYYQDIATTTGDKLYIAIKSTNNGTVFPFVRIYNFNTTNNSDSTGINNTVSSAVVDSKINGVRLYFQQFINQTYDNVTIDDVKVINLTTTFGAGNEPTEEEMDLLISTLGVDYFEGEISIPAQKVMQWQLKYTNEKASHGQVDDEKADHGYASIEDAKTLKAVDEAKVDKTTYNQKVSEIEGNLDNLDYRNILIENDLRGINQIFSWELVSGSASVVRKEITIPANKTFTLSCTSPINLNTIRIYFEDDTNDTFIVTNNNSVDKLYTKKVISLGTMIGPTEITTSGTLSLDVTSEGSIVSKQEFTGLATELEEDIEELRDTNLIYGFEKELSWNLVQGQDNVVKKQIKILKGAYFVISPNDLIPMVQLRIIYVDDSTSLLYFSTSTNKLFYAEKEIKEISTFMSSVTVTATGTLTLNISCQSLVQEKNRTSARIVIPSKLFAVVGQEFNLYYDCIGLTSASGDAFSSPYLFDIICSKGTVDKKSFRYTPVTSDLNNGNPQEYDFQIIVMNNMGDILEIHDSKLVVVPANISNNTQLMLIGDSNTAGYSEVPKFIQKYFDDKVEGRLTEVGIMGYVSREDAGNNQYYAHTGVSGARMGTFSDVLTSGVLYNMYRCQIIGFDLSKPRNSDVVKNLSQNKEYTIMMYQLDENGNGYVWLRTEVIGSAVPAEGDYVKTGDTSNVLFTLSNPEISDGYGILKTNGVYDWPAFSTRNSIQGTIDIISIDLGINDCGQGNSTIYLNNTVFDSFVNGAKEIIDSFVAYNPNGKVIICLPKSPSASRNKGCMDGYRVNLHKLRERIIKEFDNNAYGSNVIMSHSGLAIDREKGYYLNSDFNSGQELLMSEYFEGQTYADYFKYNPAMEGYHPHERGYKQVAYAMLGAIIYADSL